MKCRHEQLAIPITFPDGNTRMPIRASQFDCVPTGHGDEGRDIERLVKGMIDHRSDIVIDRQKIGVGFPEGVGDLIEGCPKMSVAIKTKKTEIGLNT